MNHDQKSDRRSDRSGRMGARGGEGVGGAQDEITQFLWTLRQWWWLLLLGGVTAAGLAWYAMSGSVPQYTSEVLLRELSEPSTLEVALSSQRAQDQSMDFGSLRELVRSRAVVGSVVDSLDTQLDFTTHHAIQSSVVEDFVPSPDLRRGEYWLLLEGGEVILAEQETGRPMARPDSAGWIEGPDFRLKVADASLMPTEEPVGILVRERERAVERLQNGVKVEPGKGASLILIRYSHPDPRISASVVNAVAEEFIQFRTAYAKEVAGQRRVVLADQLVQLSDSLRRAEDEFLQYQQSAGLLNPEAEGGALTTALTQTENHLRDLQSDRAMLQSLLASLRTTGAGANDIEGLRRIMAVARELVPGGESLYDRLEALYTERRQLTASRFGYTESGPKVQVIDSLIAGTRGQIQVLAEEALSMTNERLSNAEGRVAELRGDIGAVPQRSAQFDRLQQRVDAVQQVFDNLTEKYYEAQVAEGVESGDMEIIDPALVPRSPDPMHRNRNLAFAFLFGIMLSGGAVGTMHYFRERVSSLEEVERLTGIPVLGSIPHFDDSDAAERWESFQSLATNYRLSPEWNKGILAVTSSAPGEGKSTVAANLALVLAQDQYRVLLVDTDLRRPVQHKVFGLSQSPGLTDVVRGSVTLKDAVSETMGLNVLPCGSPVENPPALMRSSLLTELLAYIRDEYDVVILDTSPVLAVADSTIACSAADAVYVVVSANRTERTALDRSLDQLAAVDVEPAAVILSRVPTRGRYGRTQYQYYRYSSYYNTTPAVGASERDRERLQVVNPPR